MGLKDLKAKIAAQKAPKMAGGNPLTKEIAPIQKVTPVALKSQQVALTQIKQEAEAPAPPKQAPQALPKAKTIPRRPLPKKAEPEPPKEEPIQQATTPTQTPPAAPKRAIPPKRTPVAPTITKGQGEALLKGGHNVLANELPKGYVVVSKNDEMLMQKIKAEHIKRQICSLDYESTGDPDDDTQDPQDHELVSAQTCFEIGTAYYFPVGHDNYAANWNKKYFIDEFLKPVLLHPDVMVIAHNIKFEHQMSLLLGIDMLPKAFNRKVMDTMLMVKALALPENTEPKGETGHEVVVGLKPATKALLATSDGMVHGLLHVDDIKSFEDTVGKHTWEEPTGEFYKSGAKKGQPKTKTMSRSRTFNEVPVTKEYVDYGCSDADWGLGLYLKLLPMCEAEGLLDVLFELDVPFMMTLGEYEMAGWHIDPERLKRMGVLADIALDGQAHAEVGNPVHDDLIRELIAKWDPKDEYGEPTTTWVGLNFLLDNALANMPGVKLDDEQNILVPAGIYPMGRWRGDDVYLTIKTTKEFNWGSTQHKQWLFYYLLKMDTRDIERSKTTGLPGTGAKIVDKLIAGYSGDSQFMKVLKEKSSYDKILTTYVNGMLPFCREDTHKLHTSMNLVSTWRLSSKKPNLQNIPRADNDPMGIRGVFVAPIYDPNGDYSKQNIWTKPVSIITEKKLSGLTMYVNSDYSQIELKVLAWYAGEKGMIDILANGGDLHSWVAQKVFKLACEVDQVKDLYKPFRYRAKAVNFGLVYGMTEFGLSKDPAMGMTVEQAEQFIEEYMATFPGVKAYATEMISYARKYGYVETMLKHRRPIPEINHPSQWIRKKGENKAMNTPIQGSAADIIRLAMVDIRRDQPEYFKGVMQIHDELQAEVPVEYVVEGADFMQGVMERPVEGFSEIMPIISEPAIGVTWDTALELKRKPDGTPYVKPKTVKKEATDVTYDMIAPYEHYYKLAGIQIAG